MDELSMPSPYDTLRFELMDLRRRAGNPTYRRMASAWGQPPPLTVFSASTIADNLNGRRRSMSQEFVRFFVHSCWAHARRTGVALPAPDVSWSRWYGLWRAQSPTWLWAPAGPAAPTGTDAAGPGASAPGGGHRPPPARSALSSPRLTPPWAGAPVRAPRIRTLQPSAASGCAPPHNTAAVSGVA